MNRISEIMKRIRANPELRKKFDVEIEQLLADRKQGKRRSKEDRHNLIFDFGNKHNLKEKIMETDKKKLVNSIKELAKTNNSLENAIDANVKLFLLASKDEQDSVIIGVAHTFFTSLKD